MKSVGLVVVVPAVLLLLLLLLPYNIGTTVGTVLCCRPSILFFDLHSARPGVCDAGASSTCSNCQRANRARGFFFSFQRGGHKVIISSSSGSLQSIWGDVARKRDRQDRLKQAETEKAATVLY